MTLKTLLCIATALLLSPDSGAQITLATAAPSNGSGGIFFTLTTNSSPVTITKMSTCFSGAIGLNITVEIYTRPGAYAGFTTSNSGWTLLGTASASAAGTTVVAPVDVTALNIQIPANTVQSFYMHSITTGGGIRYTGTAASPPVTTFSDANLTLFSDVSRTGTAAFGGNQNSPRTFAGVIEYSLSPLSLQWIDVSARLEQGRAVISWVAEEAGTASYDLEKQVDGSYRSIARVTSIGDGTNTYKLTDDQPFDAGATEAIYRIRQTDKDGRHSYSNTVSVKNKRVLSGLSVHPNPFSNGIEIRSMTREKITVTDLGGRTVLVTLVNEGTHSFDTSLWPAGLYFIRSGSGQVLRAVKEGL